MALSFTTGMTSIDPADSTTDWAPYKITSGGGTPSLNLDTDVQVENTGCISFAPTASKDVGAVFDYYNANGNTVLNLTTAGNEVIGVWLLITSASTINTFANGGLYIGVMGVDGIPTSSNTWSKWYIAGSDTIKGGWQYYQVDTRKTPSATSNGGTTLSSVYRVFFGGLHTANTARADSFFVDASWYGRPVYTVQGDGTTVADWADFLSDSTTNENGLILDVNGALEMSCGIQIGDDAQTSTTTLTDATGQKLNWRRHTYYSSGTADALTYADYYKLSAEGAASFGTSVTIGSLVGTDQGILGGDIRSVDPANVPVIVDFNTDQSHITALNMYGVVFQGIRGAIDLGANTAFNYFSCTFLDCAQVDANGGPELRNCLFIDTADTNGSLIWNSTIDIQKSKFISNTTGPGIEHDAWNGTEEGTVTTADATGTTLIDSAATFTGNVATNDIVYNEADNSFGRVTSVDSNSQLTHTMLTSGTDNDWDSSDAYSVTTPYTYTDLEFSGNTNDVDNTVTGDNVVAISKAGTSNPSSYPTGDHVAIQGSVTLKITVKDSDTLAVIQDVQTSIQINASPYTQLMNEDTNASGVAEESYAGTTPVDIAWKTRKSDDLDNPRYLAQSGISTVESGTGLNITVLLKRSPFLT